MSKINKQLVVIADADAIVAQAFAEDINHSLTLSLGKQLRKQQAHIIFPSTAVAEAVTTLQRKFSNPGLAAATLDLFMESNIVVDSVDHEDIREARKLFDPKGSKKNTIFDCLVATLVKKHKADAIFSFDNWYKKSGFKLVADLFKTK